MGERSRELERLEAEIEGLRAEQHRLIEGFIVESWRQPLRTLTNVSDSGVIEHGWEWRYGPHGGFEAKKEAAIAAVRRAAGLGLEGGPNG